MKILDSLRKRLHRLHVAPVHELGRGARMLRFQIHLWRTCIRRLGENNAMAMSSALSFRTIFALIPILILIFLVAKSLGVIEDRKQALRRFLEDTGISHIRYEREPDERRGLDEPPTRPGGEEGEAPRPRRGRRDVIDLGESILRLVERVEAQLTIGRVGPIGVILLIWTALTLLTTLERSLNRIFEAPRSRSLVRRTLLYWSAVTLGPLIITVVSLASDEAVEGARAVPAVAWLIATLGWVLMAAVYIVLLAALYKVMPNTYVAYRSALAGALVAVPLWLLLRWAFEAYLFSVGKSTIYGALGMVPVFLLWLNASWSIFLFGAQLAQATTVARIGPELSHDRRYGGWNLLALAIALAHAARERTGPPTRTNLSTLLHLPQGTVEELLNVLCRHDLAARLAESDSRDPHYFLTADPESVPVSELLRVGCPIDPDSPAADCEPSVALPLRRAWTAVAEGVDNLTLRDLLSNGTRTP